MGDHTHYLWQSTIVNAAEEAGGVFCVYGSCQSCYGRIYVQIQK